MITLLVKTFLQFALHARDPHWSCEITHRDRGIPATYYLYCTQTRADGIEIVEVGVHVPDAKVIP